MSDMLPQSPRRLTFATAAGCVGLAIVLGADLAPGATAAPAAVTQPAAAATDAGVAMIREAITEMRFMDAERLLDQAAVAGVKDDRMTLLAGELDLNRHQLKPALAAFDELEARAATVAPAVLTQARTNRGITLSLLGRSDDAIRVLSEAVKSDPTQWRAWNALGTEYDGRRDWEKADAAYARAMETSGAAALVLNNRGYSRLMQKRWDDSAADLVAALNKRPDFPEARANLRLVLAMKGDFARAIQGGSDQDQATLLNNAGFAAAMQGDYARAEELLNRAIKLRSTYFEKAGENLKVVSALAGKDSH
jgi:Flp pilus assembly protein TadD